MPRAPRHLPSLEMLLADLQMSTREIAKLLGVTDRTVQLWKASGSAPKPVILALFWESKWGISQADSELYNTALVYRQHAESLARENQRLAQALHLTDQLTPETANAPTFYRA